MSFQNEENLHHRRSFKSSTENGDGVIEGWNDGRMKGWKNGMMEIWNDGMTFLGCRLINRCERKGQKMSQEVGISNERWRKNDRS